MNLRRALVANAAVAVLLAACGAPTASSPSIPPPPSPDSYTSALVMTRTWAASEIDIAATTTVDGVRTDHRGVGEVAIDKGYADIDWTTATTHARELVNDRAIFTQEQTPDGIWMRTESSGRTATSAFADPLLHLTRLEAVTPGGTGEMDGFEASRYRGTLPLTASNLEGLALTDDEVARIVAIAKPDDTIAVTVWIDPHHRVVRIDRSVTVDGINPVTATATTHLSNFGVMLDLESPPSASVTAPPT